ncbi:DUF6183 family protein [Nonomuraea sp. NPDC059194]|uniref:DUF6183 family protein n=1 Tax=Nonomuraea sp. NPDC059194 TaxID=3346764 RepID=UPI0036835818
MPLTDLLSQLHTVDDVTDHYDLIEQAAAEGRAGELYDLVVALRSAGPGWQRDAVLDQAQRALLLTPGEANAAHAVRLAAAERSRARLRSAAGQLAAAQPVDHLLPLYGRHKQALEFFACLTQELVLRHPDIGQADQVRQAADHLALVGHPLAALPLGLLGVEEELDLPSYGLRGAAVELPFGPSGQRGTRRRPSGRLPVDELPVPEQLTAAVDNWVSDSNGRLEARVFRLRAPIGLDARLLDGLGLACLTGKGEIHVHAATPSQVMRVLFAAASTGSAYGSGRGGAYGRLLAWRSMIALAGATDIEEVADRTWALFDASTEWFHQVAWDVGVAALDPARLMVSVLAATDED